MFGPEYIPAAYLEARLEAEKAKREAEEKREYEHAQTACRAHQAPGQPTPSSLCQAFPQRPEVPRPGSSTLLGSIYQNLAKTAAGAATPTSSQTSRGQTPCPEKAMTAEEKRAYDEKWKEIDMVGTVTHASPIDHC